ncbi:heparinase II/III family protein [Actinomycetospora termitidis]|uniref:Alginate lyase family protein n=1 Tax=Actinomycetospora termitidis TaxID=3053470 RepID=A0ABT7MEB9_9PSEU|nr:alginate lyase family protein [Actinomycetospora sp. Odt1-22]MDL5159006.1 alginate lyase family protein [Actinomycetospora sp. Odt1-22]
MSWTARLDAFRERPGLLDAAGAALVATADPAGIEAVRDAADRAVDHRFTFFAHDEAVYDGPIDWALDPVGDMRWPRRPARSIDHRTAPGDPKWIWELHRLQHLPWLAQAWLHTGEHRYAEEALAQLDSWVVDNPPDVGIGWRGAFECGVRAVSVVTALQGLRTSPALTPERFGRAVRMLDAAARRCWRDRSLHSSANNHLVGELAGLVVVGTAFPELAEPGRRRRRALDELAREADRQILPDGAGCEQAVAYQVFTADLLAVVLVALRVARDDDPATDVLAAALRRSADHLVALVGDDDPVPRIGDDDEGHALRLDAGPLRTVRAHLAGVAALTGHAGAARSGRPDTTARWYALRAAGPTAPPSSGPPGNHHAPHGGLVVLRAGDRRLTIDVGPLGHGTLAAHGHADALGITLARGGREFIGDPGTASYYGHPAWRTAARGTASHATVTVDGTDQSVMGGPFLWTRHARVMVREVDLAAGVVDAQHDGYRRLDRPVTHRRRVVARPDDAVVLIVDLLVGEGPHEYRTAWPLPPDLPATPREDGIDIDTDALRIRHAATIPWSTTTVRGDEASGTGWWSTRLESREPSWLVGGVGTTRGLDGATTAIATLLAPGDAPDPGLPTLEVRGNHVEVTWQGTAGPRRESVDLDPA